MNRIITILVTVFILLLLYIWISHVWGSDNPRHPRQIVDARDSEILGADDTSADPDTSLLTDTGSESNDYYDSEGEDDFIAEEEIPVKNEVIEDDPIEEPPVEEKPVVKKTEPKPQPKPANPPATKTSQPIAKPIAKSTEADGRHMVIVGNFLQRVNAEQRLAELQKAGFGGVEIVNFDLSEYHTVSAGRFEDVNEARRLVKKLKDYHKIDAYVRIGS